MMVKYANEYHTLALISLLLLALITPPIRATSSHPLLILVVYDGFKWDYLDMVRSHRPNTTPNFDRLAATGVTAHHVANVFTTSTMPSHMSMLTGMYPESHGIINNAFYDPNLDDWYLMNTTEHQQRSEFFDAGGEPIWVTNQNAAPDRFTGSTIFPCTLAAVKGVNVTYQIPGELFDRNITYKDRVDDMIGWLTDPQSPANLGLFYYEEPDELGHKFGPESTEVYDAIADLDELTGYLLDQLESHGLRNRTNLIFTGDHGMTYISEYRIVSLDDYVNETDYFHVGLWSMGLITPLPGKEQQVFDGLKHMQKDNPQISVFRKCDPEIADLHYCHNDRINPILVLPDNGWLVRAGPDAYNITGVAATHGYSTKYSDMWPFFIANGPAFRQNHTTEIIHQVDIYELMCQILEIQPAPNNGSLDRIRHILRPQYGGWGPRPFSLIHLTYIIPLALFLIVVGVVFVVAQVRTSGGIRKHRRDSYRMCGTTDNES